MKITINITFYIFMDYSINSVTTGQITWLYTTTEQLATLDVDCGAVDGSDCIFRADVLRLQTLISRLRD